jgi:acetylornithine deacetylase/succinyl-diaminopimelate desuccinylase-like protein
MLRMTNMHTALLLLLAALNWRAAHEREIVTQFMQLLSIPNLASDAENINRNAEAIKALLESRGVKARVIRDFGAPPLVVGELAAPDAKTTIAFYAHYDGQPVDAAQWTSPPWSPVLRDQSGNAIDPSAVSAFDPEWRIYARGAGDDKVSIVAMLGALDAMHAAKINPSVNVKFVYEGEEEAGSPHLGAYLDKYADALHADAWFLCDGPVHQSRRMQLFFGARGVTDLELTVYGPIKGLHSGHYGNWVPNPIVDLTHLVDSMRDAAANVLIKDFYDDVAPLTESEKKAIAEIPDVDADLKREFAIARTEGDGRSLNEQILKPAINLRGIAGGRTGATASNTIATEASASFDFRLVPNETPDSIRAKVEKHISDRGWFIVRDAPDVATRLAHPRIARLRWGAGYPPYRTSMDTPFGKSAVAIVANAVGYPPVRLPSLGGSIPMYLFARGGVPVIGLPIANHDDNQHAANENLRLHNLWDGIEIYTALFSQLK